MMIRFIELGNGSDSLIESVEYSVLERLGIEYFNHVYKTNLVALEDTRNRFEGLLSVIRGNGGDVIAQATIISRRPFSHAEVLLMDYR